MLQNRKARRSRQCQIIQPVQLFAEITAITAALTCKTRDAPSRQEHPERWPSGLRRTLGKRVCGKPYRGFESHSLRQFLCTLHTNEIPRADPLVQVDYARVVDLDIGAGKSDN